MEIKLELDTEKNGEGCSHRHSHLGSLPGLQMLRKSFATANALAIIIVIAIIYGPRRI